MSELWRRSAVDLAAMIRIREVSSREVVQAHLDRIGEVNPDVHAIVAVLTEEALHGPTMNPWNPARTPGGTAPCS